MKKYAAYSETRKAYIQADSLARKMGVRTCYYTSQHNEIRSRLRSQYGIVMAATVVSAYLPKRDLATSKYIFALLCLAHRAQDTYQQMSDLYGHWHAITDSAYAAYTYQNDLYYETAMQTGGLLSTAECHTIVSMQHDAWRNLVAKRNSK